MRRTRVLALAVIMVGALTAALMTNDSYGLGDVLMGVLVNFQTRLPATITLEQLLIAVATASLIILTVVLGAAGLLLSVARTRYTAARLRVQGETERLEAQQRVQLEQLMRLGVLFSERLEKRFLMQSVVEAASRLTSVAQVDSAVSLWRLNFANDVFEFEQGKYCDQTTFIKPAFQLDEAPFSKVLQTKQPVCYASLDEQPNFINAKKTARWGSATAVIAVPLLIEGAVLNVVVIFCHPDMLTRYRDAKGFYDVAWKQLTLAMGIAMQEELAIMDRQTGLYNRDYFLKRLMQEVDRANRYGLPMTLCMMDIDHFKVVNDTLGHLQGDAVLKIVSKLIKKSIRAIDLAARYGGDEFVVLLPETGGGAGEGSAAAVAERVRRSVEEEFSEMQGLKVTISVGVVLRRFPEDRHVEDQELLRLADQQLYRAKTDGRNRVSVASTNGSASERRLPAPPVSPSPEATSAP